MSDKIKHMFDGMIMSTEKKIIKRMVNRFLCWRLPENFSPDAGISFTPEFNKEYMASIGKPPMRHEPTGTNLLDAVQAEQMIRHILADELESFRAECVKEAHQVPDDYFRNVVQSVMQVIPRNELQRFFDGAQLDKIGERLAAPAAPSQWNQQIAPEGIAVDCDSVMECKEPDCTKCPKPAPNATGKE